uniref:Uncharacterized protein n=1 Tax=Anguilla anguilla TaxID=7936 RepID=A0A0E9QET2_ANGAN
MERRQAPLELRRVVDQTQMG